MAAAATPGGRRWQGLFLFLVLFAMTGEASAATGQVTITGPVPGPNGVYEATGDFSVQGTYIMTEDDTPTGTGTHERCKDLYPYMNGKADFGPTCWDWSQWEGIYAIVDYEVDGKWSGKAGELEYWYGPNPHSDLGLLKDFSARVSISGLPPRPYHTVRVYLQDVLSVACYYGAGRKDDPDCIGGATVASATFQFRAPTDIPPFKMEANLGDPKASCPNLGTNNPINLATGNKYLRDDDFAFSAIGGSLSFSRSYNSQSTYDGPLGYGWTHTYNLKLELLTDTTLRIMRSDGRYSYFVKAGLDFYRGMGNEYARVDVVDTDYLLREVNGGLYVFDAGGRLTRIEDRHGNAILLGYDGGLLTSVQDAGSGRTLAFTYTDGKLAAVSGPATAGNPSGTLVTLT